MKTELSRAGLQLQIAATGQSRASNRRERIKQNIEIKMNTELMTVRDMEFASPLYLQRVGALAFALLLAAAVLATTIVYTFGNGSTATFTSSGGTWSASHSFGETHSNLSTPQATALLNDWASANGGISGSENKDIE